MCVKVIKSQRWDIFGYGTDTVKCIRATVFPRNAFNSR